MIMRGFCLFQALQPILKNSQFDYDDNNQYDDDDDDHDQEEIMMIMIVMREIMILMAFVLSKHCRQT